MKIIVNSDRSIQKEYEGSEINDGSQNENRVTTITFEVPEDYSSFAKRIVFITKDGNYFDEIVNDEYVLKNNVTKYKKLLAFVWLVNSTTHQDFRSEAFPLEFNYNENFTGAVPSEEELSEIELLFDQLEALIAEVESIDNLTYEIVEELPTEDIDPHVIYMILKEESEPNNVYNEWMYINEEWELIGTTAIDLQPLQKEIDEINEMLFTHTTAESVNQEVSLNGNPNLEMNVTELDGRAEQDSTQGYQLFDIDLTPSANKQYVRNNGFILTKGINRTIQIGLHNPLPAGTYTLSAVVKNSTLSNNSKINCSFKDSNNMDVVANVSFLTNGTITTTAEVAQLYFFIVNTETDGVTITLDDIMLESGSTAHDWEQYTGGQASPNPDYKQDIHVVTGTQDVVVSGKNYVDINSKLENALITPTAITNGLYTLLYKKLKAGTYTFSSPSYLQLVYCFTDNIPTTSTTNITRVVENLNAPYSFTTSKDCYICYRILFYDGQTIETEVDLSRINREVQIEKGSTATTYEPYYNLTKQVHLGEIELAKIGTYKDKIYPSGGKWYLHKEIRKKTFIGASDEEWIFAQVSSGTLNAFSYEVSNIQTDELLLANYFRGVPNYSYRTDNTTYSKYVNSKYYIDIIMNSMNSTTNFKNWLSTHNTIVYYILLTPTDTEITGTLKEELDAIQKLQQLNGKTIVSIEGDLAADFKLVYENDSISDLNTRVGNIESNYVKRTDYATDNTAGVIITNSARGFSLGSSHQALASVFTNEQYASKDNYTFIGKGTLENVLNARIGDINTMLDQMNREVV